MADSSLLPTSFAAYSRGCLRNSQQKAGHGFCCFTQPYRRFDSVGELIHSQLNSTSEEKCAVLQKERSDWCIFYP
jgi:hypothetical protein